MNYWFANLVPEKWRWAHHCYAWLGFYYWGPCNTCDRIFGGHEWRDIDGKVSSIPDPKQSAGSSIGICPACTRAGRGVPTAPWLLADFGQPVKRDPDWLHPRRLPNVNGILTEYAEKAGRLSGMTADQVIAYIALGDRMHGDARPGECGAVDPRKESRWCREPEGHAGGHSPVASPRGICGVLLPPYDPYTYCHRSAGHAQGLECTENLDWAPEGITP